MNFKLEEQLQEQRSFTDLTRAKQIAGIQCSSKEKVLPKTIILTYVDDDSNPSTHGFKLFQSVKLVC